MQLWNQLEVVCQRQCDAYRRNQDLLRDFKRIEHELAHLAAKTDNVRINQENYMMQLQTILPMHYKYLTPSSYAISKQSCHTIIGNLPADCGNFAKKSHPTDSISRSGQFLWPNRLIGIQGCCRRSTCCRCVYPSSDGSFVLGNSKMSDSAQPNVSQKERRSTNDLLFHREDSSNTKDVRTQQCQERTNKIITTSTMPPRQCALEYIWNKDAQEKCPVGAPEQGVKNKVKVRKSFKENNREISALHQEVLSNSFVSECKFPIGSVCKLKHLPSALICLKYDDDDDDDDNDDDDTENVHKVAERLSHQPILSKNIDDYNEEELKVEAHENKEKASCKSSKNGQMVETLQKSNKEKILKHTSKMEHNGKEVESQPTVKDLNNQTLSTKCDKVHDVEFFGIVADGLFEEINDCEEISDSKGNKLVKGKARNPTPSLNELLNRQNSLENYQSQNEGSVQSESSQKDSSSESGGRQSVFDTCFQMKERKNVIEEARCELGTPSKDNFITQNDETGEEKIGDESDSQHEEVGEDGDVKMLEGKLKYTEIKTSKTKEAKNCLTYGENVEMTSNSEEEDDEESVEENDPGCEISSILEENEGEIKDTKSSEGHESDVEKADGDEKVDDDKIDDDDHDEDVDGDKCCKISGEEGKTGDRIQNSDNLEENCSIEENKNEAISEREEESRQEEEQSSCEDQDEIRDTEGSEDEENLLACDNKDKGLEAEETDKNLSLKYMSEDGDLNMETSVREEESVHSGEQAAASSQELNEDEEAYKENQRPLWLCCLKSCSRAQFSDKRQHQKRCSEDGSMDLLQLNPVESRSSLPDQESPSSPTSSRQTEVASVLKAPSEDSSEEFSHNEKESEESNPGRSDSEDDVHSFYD